MSEPLSSNFTCKTEDSTMDTDTLFRPRAFIPRDTDEGPFDYLGFWHHGTFRGEWNGTSAWLADMPLPDGIVIDSLVKELPATFTTIQSAREAVAEGHVEPVVLLAPVMTRNRFAVLPIDGHPYDVDPNFVAHIERSIPGGEWFITTEAVAKMINEPHHAVLVYVVDGEARGLVAPIKQEMPDA